MEPKKLLNADYLDIIYDQRNKKYGGYELRRHYSQRLRKAAAFALTGIAAIFSFSFITNSRGGHQAAGHIDTVITLANIKPYVQPPAMPKIIPPSLPVAQQVKTQMRTVPVIEPNDLVPPDKQMTPNKDLGSTQPGPANHDGDSTGLTASIGKGTGTGVVDNNKGKSAEPVRFVEQMPVFAGDMNAYLGKNIRYPELASSAGIEGRVTIEFVVNEDGTVSNARVVHGIGGGCDEEALRIVNGMPKWKPGKQNGIPVKVFFMLPIVFKLN